MLASGPWSRAPPHVPSPRGRKERRGVCLEEGNTDSRFPSPGAPQAQQKKERRG